ncbi:MgtC/SapB family protein [Aquabacter sp. L1I39]|uniref:MgtC/SapB family protein n=1 Tax=Aquabacter sp. L1I39 TaxID=2820278 RepID=UPI001ADB211F|nr:MgtC/SapB family protein [Aquabacter sp. L1I39]QTL03739.1 MgtC/SapB family protein [Aquabacter sp. L1I39]
MEDVGLALDPHDIDSVLRLAVAVAVGMAVGLNRDLKGKPTGIRTLGLVCLGAALVAVVSFRVDGILGHPDATSRVLQGVIQGVMTGIGFLGAGVVLVDRVEMRIQGLTTAATVWVTAALGIACALASWTLILAGVGLALFLLVLAHPLERWLEARSGDRKEEAPPRLPSRSVR